MPRLDIVAHRLAAQGLLSPPAVEPADVVRRLGAMQAQDYDGAKWAIGLRARGTTDADVERAFAAGAILRTHVLRPTWHFVAPADIRWMLALTAPRVNVAMAFANRWLELDAALFRRSNAAIAAALEGGREATRAELAAALERRRIALTSHQRLAHIVMQAELDGIICSGARRGRQFTYALLDERVPAAAPLDRDEALLELATRYFGTRGPATAHDFAWWSGLTLAEARRGIESAGARLERVVLDGVTYWMTPAAPARRRRSRAVHLLPNYDEYFIGYRDRRAIGERLGSVQLVTGGDGRTRHVVTVDGQLVGGWTRSVTTRGVALTVAPLATLSAEERRAIGKAAAAYGAFLGQPVTVGGID